MDSNTTQDPTRQSHLPITEAEMNPNMHQESPSSPKNTLLTLASILVLAGIVVLTLFLYIQNKQAGPNKNSQIKPTNAEPITAQAENPPPCTNSKIYKSITEALKEPEKVCTLDLSNQNLRQIPPEIFKLSNLRTLDLSKNNISNIPDDISQLKNLQTIVIKNNPIDRNIQSKLLKLLPSIGLIITQ